jgi:hypothetical protein
MPSLPLSTRLTDYGSFQIVQGDFGDQFLLLTRWDAAVSLYQVKEGTMEFIEVYDTLNELLTAYPGFSIINPSNANERYLPSYLKYPVEKHEGRISKKYACETRSGGWLPVGEPRV